MRNREGGMNLWTRFCFLLLITLGNLALTMNPALAHSFNVALLVPLSTVGSVQGRQYVEGFMLATTERDSHPDQESDGHLGGLDVYVTKIDAVGNITEQIGRIALSGNIDILAFYGADTVLHRAREQLDGKEVALLLPGEAPSLDSSLPAVAAFISSYERVYGRKPSSDAAQGYNAARRIDAAVRAQGGVDDFSSLLWNLTKSERGFAW